MPAAENKQSYRIKGSKFYGYLKPCVSVSNFESQLDSIRSEYPDATHHCYAYRINPVRLKEFDQDDGEPGGTAGKPILNKMRSAELVNATLVVVRYFGGTKLGISGLIEAYGHTAELCIQSAKLQQIRLIKKFQITYPYPEQNIIEKLRNRWKLVEVDATYLEKATLTLGCPVDQADAFESELKQQTAWREFDYRVMGKDFCEN